MPSGTLIPVTEYLTTSYRPDCEYIDGELQERNLGEKDHAIIQRELSLLFRMNRATWGVEVFQELRMQISSSRFRVPDIAVVKSDVRFERWLKEPPLLIVEVLSPEDTLRKTRERVEDYLGFGVQHVWIIDPARREAYRCTHTGFQQPEQAEIVVQGTPIRIALAELFAELDR